MKKSYILNENNDIYIFDNEKECFTQKICNLYSDIKFIDSGLDHTVFVNYDNKIYVKGNNEYGELGVGSHYKRKNFVELKFYPKKEICIVI